MMILEIGNMYTKITGGSPKTLAELNNSIAAITPGYQFVDSYKKGHWDGKTRFMRVSAKSSKFPTGLLSNVVRTLRKLGDEFELEDKRDIIDHEIPLSIDLGHKVQGTITLRDYQYRAVVDGLLATRGVVNIATNGGKTEVAAGIIKCILPCLKPEQRLVFFTHAREIFHQTHARLEERLGIKVGLIGDEIWDEQQITVVMIPTIGKYLDVPKILPKNAKRTKLLNLMASSNPEEQRALRSEITSMEEQEWFNIKEKVEKSSKFLQTVVGFLADEVHHASSDAWYELFMHENLSNCFYRFGLTGTIDDKDEKGELNLFKLLGSTGRVFCKISNQFLIDNGYSAKPTIHMLKFNSSKIRSSDHRVVVEEGIIHNTSRNKAFTNKVVARANSGKQCLIIVAETSHGNVVQEMLEGTGLEPIFIHGGKASKYRKDRLREFTEGKIQVLIATTILDEGVDISGINCLFLMAGGKSMKKVLQRVGRGIRKKADGSGVEVFDAVDSHSMALSFHYKERLDIYKKEGFEIIEGN